VSALKATIRPRMGSIATGFKFSNMLGVLIVYFQ
jgi:hypothetical protein